MTIAKTPLQTIVSIAHGADGAVTHAWKVTAFVVTEDGQEISRGTTGQENIEPEDLAKALPDQAALLAQLGAKDAAALAAQAEAAKALEDATAAHAAEVATLQGQLAETRAKLQDTQNALDAATRKLGAVAGHVEAAAAAANG